MPVQVWTPGQVLTAAELTTITNLLPYPSVTSVGVNPCVAGTLYRCTNSSAITMTLPAPTAGTAIGFVLDSATPGAVSVTHNAAELIYGATGNGTSRGANTVVLTLSDQVLFLISDGTNWHELDNGPTPGLAAKSATVATSETTTSATYANLTTPGPAVTLVTGTQALITLNATLANNTQNAVAYMGVAVSGATTIAAADTQAIAFQAPAANAVSAAGSTFLVTGLTAGVNTFTAKYRVPSGTGTYSNRQIIGQP